MKKFWTDVTEQEYERRRAEYETAHSFQEFRKCPLIYKMKKDGAIQPQDSAVFAFGRANHTLILQGDVEYEKTYAIGGPINEKTGRPYGAETKAFAEWAQAQGKPVLTVEQDRTIRSMREAINAHPIAGAFFGSNPCSESCEPNLAEVTVEAEDLYGHRCQSRIDWISETMQSIIDLKTTASLDKFEYDCRDYGYHTQLAFYRDICKAAGWKAKKCYLVAIEKTMPYRVGVWEISEKTLDKASEINRITGNNLSEAKELNQWPTLYEDIRSLSIE